MNRAALARNNAQYGPGPGASGPPPAPPLSGDVLPPPAPLQAGEWRVPDGAVRLRVIALPAPMPLFDRALLVLAVALLAGEMAGCAALVMGWVG